MIDEILNKTPGLLFTIMLIAFTLGSMVNSIMAAKKINEEKLKPKPAA
jgi:hypothetical protein